MENFTLPAKPLKAAKRFQASNDVRYYLNGILVSTDGKIVATDGHRMIVIESEEAKSFESDTIIKLYGTIPVSAHKCHFHFIDENSGVVTMTNGHDMDTNKTMRFELVDGRFPDYKRVMPKGKREAVESIGLNLVYAGIAGDAIKDLGLKFVTAKLCFYGQNNATLMKVRGIENADIVIMPTRL